MIQVNRLLEECYSKVDAPMGLSQFRISLLKFSSIFETINVSKLYQESLLSLLHSRCRRGVLLQHGHAVLDLPSREAKAKKIERLLKIQRQDYPLRVLEIGTGSGGIANYFGCRSSVKCDVISVDVADNRRITEGFEFRSVVGVKLPFPDDFFDLVISNHVIEHVGESDAQLRHLAEMRRVMSESGCGYLAVPNRWQWVEPHYRLAALSWLPEKWRTPYLRWRRRGEFYDCNPLTVRQLEKMLESAGFAYQQQHFRALCLTYELEQPDAPVYKYVFKHIPEKIFAMLRGAFPTLIYILKR